jgi:hypothetical protein
LERSEADAKRLHRPFFVPGLRRLLRLAGVTEHRGGDTLTLEAGDFPVPDPLPNDLAMLKAIIRRLMSRDRVQRAELVVLRGRVADGISRQRLQRMEIAKLRRQIRQMPNLAHG